jgi:hypothetical protein
LWLPLLWLYSYSLSHSSAKRRPLGDWTLRHSVSLAGLSRWRGCGDPSMEGEGVFRDDWNMDTRDTAVCSTTTDTCLACGDKWTTTCVQRSIGRVQAAQTAHGERGRRCLFVFLICCYNQPDHVVLASLYLPPTLTPPRVFFQQGEVKYPTAIPLAARSRSPNEDRHGCACEEAGRPLFQQTHHLRQQVPADPIPRVG